jgi:oligosaccharide repeat unit polymerase
MFTLLVVLFILLFAIYYSATRSFISPFSLLLLSFIMALTIIIYNNTNWQVRANPRLPIYIFTAVFSFAIGNLLAGVNSFKLLLRGGTKCVAPTIDVSRGRFSRIIFLLVPVLITVIYVAMSIRMGRSGGDGSLLRNIYVVSVNQKSNFLFHQFREIVVAIAEVSIIKVFCYKCIEKKRIPYMLFVPTLCFSVCTIFSTDRNVFLRFIIYSICIWIFFRTATTETTIKKTNRVILKKTVFILAVAVGLFYFLGQIKSYTSSFEREVGIYGGSGLYNFNLCLDQLERWPRQLGKETFSQLLGTLRALGLDFFGGGQNRPSLEWVIFSSPNDYVYASNIYSAMTPYVQDFGLFGVVLFPFLMGFVFKKLYSAAIHRGSMYSWGIYSLLVYGVVYFTICEQFFMRFHLGMVYELGWFSVIYYCAIGSSKYRIRKGIL